MPSRKEMTERAEAIRNWLKRGCVATNKQHRAALIRGIEFMQSRQTDDELNTRSTRHHNAMGWNGMDANFGSSLAEGAGKYGDLTEKQAAAAARMLVKYSGQLAAMPDPNDQDENYQEEHDDGGPRP
jgi:hypothetical protein